MERRGGGCALVVVGILVIGLLMWALAVTLMILGIAVALGGIIAAGMIVAAALRERRRAGEVAEMNDVIALVAADCAQSLNTTLLDLDAFIRSRGVGTRHEQTLFENPGAFRAQRRQLEEMISRLRVAPDSTSRLTAIPEAEALRLRVRKLLDGED